MRCQNPACGMEIGDGDAFCEHCGTPVAPPVTESRHCPHCGHALGPGAAFCQRCGTPVRTARSASVAARSVAVGNQVAAPVAIAPQEGAAATPVPVPPASRPRRRWGVVVAAGAIVLAATVTLLLVFHPWDMLLQQDVSQQQPSDKPSVGREDPGEVSDADPDDEGISRVPILESEQVSIAYDYARATLAEASTSCSANETSVSRRYDSEGRLNSSSCEPRIGVAVDREDGLASRSFDCTLDVEYTYLHEGLLCGTATLAEKGDPQRSEQATFFVGYTTEPGSNRITHLSYMEPTRLSPSDYADFEAARDIISEHAATTYEYEFIRGEDGRITNIRMTYGGITEDYRCDDEGHVIEGRAMPSENTKEDPETWNDMYSFVRTIERREDQGLIAHDVYPFGDRAELRAASDGGCLAECSNDVDASQKDPAHNTTALKHWTAQHSFRHGTTLTSDPYACLMEEMREAFMGVMNPMQFETDAANVCIVSWVANSEWTVAAKSYYWKWLAYEDT